MDEIRVSGSEPGGAHVAGNLPAMICGMGNDVEQHVVDSAGPAFSLAIHIFNLPRQTVFLAFLEV